MNIHFCYHALTFGLFPTFSQGWLDEVIRGIPQAFESALERWRFLYRAARNQADQANRIILDHSRIQDHDSAKRLRQEAETQLRLLTDKQSAIQSDFYTYRYFASGGLNCDQILDLRKDLERKRGGGNIPSQYYFWF